MTGCARLREAMPYIDDIYACMYVCMYVCIYIGVKLSLTVMTFMYVYIYVLYLCIYTHTHTSHTLTHTHTHITIYIEQDITVDVGGKLSAFQFDRVFDPSSTQEQVARWRPHTLVVKASYTSSSRPHTAFQFDRVIDLSSTQEQVLEEALSY